MNKKLQERMERFIHKVTVYPVSCEKLANERTDKQWLTAVLAGGAKIVQLRDKESDDRTLYNKALEFRRQTKEAGALFMVNNRIDIAILAGADGVHLGNTDIPPLQARELAPDMIIGVSANTKEQAASAKDNGASYYNIGPIFPTKTKANLMTFLGPQAIKEFSAKSDLPFTVMGGVKFENINELISQGARRLAVVTALSKATNIEQETQRWIEGIRGALAQ